MTPPSRDRMAGAYVKKCGGEVCGWPTRPGASCSGKCGWGAGRTSAWRRKVEWRRVQRYLRSVLSGGED